VVGVVVGVGVGIIIKGRIERQNEKPDVTSN
jgi:hypothetical protein